jgi:hypothetical protein
VPSSVAALTGSRPASRRRAAFSPWPDGTGPMLSPPALHPVVRCLWSGKEGAEFAEQVRGGRYVVAAQGEEPRSEVRAVA